MKNKCYIFLWLILLISCELVVDIDVPAQPDLLVVNCIFDAQGRWKAHVSQSKSVDEFAFYPYFDDAIILVTRPDGSSFYIEGDSVPPMNSETVYNYRFLDSEPIVFDQSYKIKVIKDGFPEAISETIVPKPIKIGSYEMDTTSQIRPKGGNQLIGYEATQNDLVVRFTDLPGEDYYALRLKVFRVYEYQNNDSIWQETVMTYEGLESNNAILEDYMQYSDELLFSDKTFTNQEFEIKAKYSKYALENAASLTLELCTVPEAYYFYRHKQKQQNWVEGDPFAEPVRVKGNIVNGYGIFTGFSSDTVHIKL